MGTITDDLQHALGNGVPAGLCTCAKDGTPNISYLSEVFYVDEEHVALSFQFFNKTKRNIEENPVASIWLLDFMTPAHFVLGLEFVRSETEGDIYDAVEERIEMIASMQGMEDVFELKAADIYRVTGVEKIAFDG
jgi:adenylate cyclase